MAEQELTFGLFGVGAGRSGREVRLGEMSAGRPEAGVSGSGGGGDAIYSALYAPFSPPAWRWGSSWELGPVSPRVGRGWSMGGGAARFFLDPRCEDQPRHFLDACTTCGKALARVDIFMYIGMPFCSDECREKRIVMEESRGKKVSPSNLATASPPRKEQKKQKRKASQDIQVPPAGTVMAG
ncbi:hypothetical protein Taro_019914 [Colocasia esculenta]|uniref:FLZ-type domain-containing protein n=1 Tax=Colocasia esculenta TaxID=4460 RepID=A0A843UV19_COLES|nr:hypothetical protein [Colocasia esculenta]